MANKKNARRAVFTSVMSLILCCAMLLGTTFAWFTDNVTSGINQINAGNLDVELYYGKDKNPTESVQGGTELFTDKDGNVIEKWEPGVVAYTNLQVANEGTLALKYQLSVNFSNMNYVEYADGNRYTLADALSVAVVDNGFEGGREAAHQLAEEGKMSPLSSFVLPGELEANSESDVYGIVIYWEPGEDDNLFNMNNNKTTSDGEALKIDLGINLFATQLDYESDSFGPDYDETASMKATANADGSATLTAPSAPSATVDNTTIEAPAGAFEPSAEVEVVVSSDNSLFNVSSEGAVVATLDVTLLVNGEEHSVELTDGVYTVKTYISKGLTGVEVRYTGTDGKDQPNPEDITYDPDTGLLVFTTNHFSEYAVTGKAYGYTGDTAYGSAEAAAEAIVSGVTVNIAESDKEAVVNAADEETRKDVVAALATVKIGNSNYLTLAEAMNNVATNGSQISNVTLLTDTTVEAGTVKVPTGAIVKLDLNGKKLSAVSNAAAASYAIDNKGVLTIMNGTVTYNGVGDSNFGYGTNTINNSGKLTVEGATIINTTSVGSSVAIDNTAGATLIIDSGRIESEKNAIRLCPFGDAAINCTINDGTITGARAVQIQLPSNNPESAPEINLTVNGGTLNGTTGLSIYSYSAGQSFANVKIMLKGGTYNNEVAFGGGNAKTTQETVSISENSCVFNADVYRYLANDGIQYLISDGTIDSGEELNMVLAKGGTVVLTADIELTDTVTVPAGVSATLDLNGHTISQTKACTESYNMIANNGTLTITGNGKLSFNDTGAGDPNVGWASYTVRNSGTLTVENGTIEHLGTQTYNGNNAIFHYSGNTTINGGTISAPYSRSLRVWNGSATINNGTFDGQVWVQAMSDCSLTINGGSFKPATYGNDGSSVFVTNDTHNPAVSVTGGNFATKFGCSDANKLAGCITGGEFTEAAKANTNSTLFAG